jgi:hypothetical protein
MALSKRATGWRLLGAQKKPIVGKAFAQTLDEQLTRITKHTMRQ